jgi:nucleolar protein 53
MGKKRGAVVRAKKRANEAAAELLDQTIDNQEIALYEAKEDGELFVIDKAPNLSQGALVSAEKKNKRKQSSSLNLKQSKKNRISENEERQIKKILSTHSTEKVISLAKADEQRMMTRKRSKRIAGNAKTNFDLWGNGDNVDEKDVNNTKLIPVKSGIAAAAGTAAIEFKAVTKTSLRKDIQQPAELSKKQLKFRALGKEKARKTIKVDLAQPGQSYRPDKEQHQDVIGEALSIELRRKEAQDYTEAPIGGGGMSADTLALLVGSSDEESSDEEDDEYDVDITSTTPMKRKEKLTRAQRNKQKRVKALQVAIEERKRVKKLLNSVQDAKKISKEIRKEEFERVTRRKEINALKEEEKARPLGINIVEKLSQLDPINAPSLPVALTEELKDGTLRTVKPKGSLLTDRLESMISRKMANRKTTDTKRMAQGKKRRMKGGKGREFLLA